MSNLAVQRQAVNHNKAAAQMTNNTSSLSPSGGQTRAREQFQLPMIMKKRKQSYFFMQL